VARRIRAPVFTGRCVLDLNDERGGANQDAC
jgi:hypothetical protein